MLRGSFNKIYKLKNIVLKINVSKDKFSKAISDKIDSKHYIKYQNDLNKCGIKTSKIYFHVLNCFLVEERIYGITLQEIFENPDYDLDFKINLIFKLIDIYNKTLKADVCLDCNMKNFIYNENNLIYIDFVPSIYKTKVEKIFDSTINEYKKNYIDSNIQILSILNYAIKALLYLDKKDLRYFKDRFVEYTNVNFDIEEGKVVMKAKLFNEYINSEMTINSLKEQYRRIGR